MVHFFDVRFTFERKCHPKDDDPQFCEENWTFTMSFIPEERDVKILSDAVNLMPENVKTEAAFINLIIGMKKENVEFVLKHIDENNIKNAIKVIYYSIFIRPLETESYLTLVSLILSKLGTGILSFFSNRFCSLLNARGILNLPNKEVYNENFEKFAAGSIEEAIIEDNVEHFCDLISDPSFDAKNENVLCPFTMIKCRTYMQLIAYFGAVDCFRQAMMNDAFDIEGISAYAIAGGSNEIVRILEQKGVSFDNCFRVGVIYHRMDLCDWLLMHAKCESISLSKSLEYFNYPAFFFTLNNENSIINEASSSDALLIASKNGLFEVVKFLIEQCRADVKVKDNDGKTSLHVASNYGHIEIVEYLVEQCHANIEAKDNDGRAPFQVSFGIIREYLRF